MYCAKHEVIGASDAAHACTEKQDAAEAQSAVMKLELLNTINIPIKMDVIHQAAQMQRWADGLMG